MSSLKHPRRWVRHLALDALSVRDRLSGALDASLRRPRVHFLYFHDIAPEHLPKFRRLLEELAQTGEFASYTTAIERLRAGTIDRPIYNLSFDDGFESCVAAARVIEAFGGSACFFVNPSVVGETDPAAAARFATERCRVEARPFMNWAQIEGLRAAGHEIGNHTLTHTDLGHPDRPLDEEIASSRDAIVRQLGECRHFAWPFGRFSNFSAAARDAVFAAGHETCASAVRGAHVAAPASPEALCVRREHLLLDWPMRHLRYFIARSAASASAADNAWPSDLAGAA